MTRAEQSLPYKLPETGPGRIAPMSARFGGFIVDWFVLAVPTSVISVFVGGYHHTRTCAADGRCANSCHLVWSWYVTLIFLAFGMGYWAVLVGMRMQSVGHRIAGIRVVEVTSGEPIGPRRAALRWLVLCVTGAIATLGFWSPFFDGPRRRGWHDKASRAIVITAR